MTTIPIQQNFGFGELEAELRDLARRFLNDQIPTTRLRELVATDHEAIYARGEPAGWDPDLWAQIGEMGWTALRFWESDIRRDVASVVRQIQLALTPSR